MRLFPGVPVQVDRDEAIPESRARIGQTFNAQWGRLIGPIAEGNQYWMDLPEFNEEGIRLVEDAIEGGNFTASEQRHLRLYGTGGQEYLEDAIQYINSQRSYQQTLDRSTGLNLFLTDPATGVSMAIPFGGIATLRGIRTIRALRSTTARVPGVGPRLTERAVSRFGDDLRDVSVFAPERLTEIPMVGQRRSPLIERMFSRPVTQALEAQMMMNGTRPTAAQIARAGALDGAVVDGTVSITQALEDITGRDVDPDVAIMNATLLTASSTILGGVIGAGIGGYINRTSRPPGSVRGLNEFQEHFRQHLNGVSQPAAQPGGDLSYPGFAADWFMKLVPTPIRTELADQSIPENFKLDLLRLGGDSAMPFAMNQAGRTVGASVYVNAGRRHGEWVQVLETINGGYRQANGLGATEILNVPVGAAANRVLRMAGRGGMSPEEWYNHIGRLYIDEVPYEQMAPHEVQSVQAVEQFFTRWQGELEEIGFLNPRDFFEESLDRTQANITNLESAVQGIVRSNREWMARESDYITDLIAKKQSRLDNLDSQFAERGLSESQIRLRDDISAEIEMLRETQQRFDEMFDQLDSARTVDELAALHDNLQLTPRMEQALGTLSRALQETRARIAGLQEVIEFRNARQRRYFPRFFNRRAIEQRTEEFRGILTRHFRENNEFIQRGEDGVYRLEKANTDPEALARRVDETINNILGQTEDAVEDIMFTGFGRSGPLMQRTLDIPNDQIKDFIVTDVKEIMIGYTERVAPRVEYHRQFPGPNGRLMSLEEKLTSMREALDEAGVAPEVRDRHIKNFVATYDRIVGTTLQNPDRWDTRVAQGLRTAASWTYLRSSGIAAIGDLASLMMDHEIKKIGKGIMSMIEDPSLFRMAQRELKLAGDALEIIRGTVHLRYFESLSNNGLTRSLTDRINNAYYIMNGLSIATVGSKTLEGMLRMHTLIDASRKLVDGSISDFDRTLLARYNIDEQMARRIASQPTETTPNGLIMPNTDAWTDPEAVISFRNALRSGVMNRIISAGPGDKPITMDGVAYIPDRVARMLPYGQDLPSDPRVPGYRRIESGLLALPFTFYSYTFGALSKITGNHMAGAVRNRMSHIAVAMLLGAMIVKARTPSYVWDEMDLEDKVMRAFDFSGIAALYSDLGYRTLGLIDELGVESNFPIQPKFDAETDPLSALVSFGGAPLDWTYEVGSSVGELVRGEVTEGVEGLIRVMPLLDTLGLFGGLRSEALAVSRSILPE